MSVLPPSFQKRLVDRFYKVRQDVISEYLSYFPSLASRYDVNNARAGLEAVDISNQTSNQSRLPAEFKHITKRRKRN